MQRGVTSMTGWLVFAVGAWGGAVACSSAAPGIPLTGGWSADGDGGGSQGGDAASGSEEGGPDSGSGGSSSGGGMTQAGDSGGSGGPGGPGAGGPSPDAGSGTGSDGGGAGESDGGGGAAGDADDGGTGGATTGIAAILSESAFDSLFPNRNSVYTYAGLLQAAGMYSGFATTGASDDEKREVAAFLANVGHETGDLVYTEEIQKAAYCQSSSDCPCASGQEYYGRGSLQLSWNYNYCAAGAALGQNLQANPELVATDSTLAWSTGVWFWMTSTGSGGQTCHEGIASSGFGATIQVINGGLECNGANTSEMQDRVQRYLNLCSMFGVSPGNNTTC